LSLSEQVIGSRLNEKKTEDGMEATMFVEAKYGRIVVTKRVITSECVSECTMQ
jgi:hypothetical protein